MSLLHLSTVPEPMLSAQATKPPSEAAHLRRVIEKQPACLMRVGLDGLLMAANDAALGLLGAQDHSQVLGGLLTRWIVPADLDRWRDFAATVAAGASVSIECDITDLSGTHRCVAFYAVPLIDHHDDIPSMILGARDESGLRRLEASLREADMRRQDDTAQPAGAVDHSDQDWLDLKAQLQQSTSEREELAALLIESEGAHQELSIERERLQQATTKLAHLEQLLKTGRTHLQDLKKKAESADAERQHLATQLAEREAEHQQLLADHGGVKDTLTEQHQQELVSKEREAQEQLTHLRTQLEVAVHDREQLASQMAERGTAHEQLIAEQADLRSTLAERQQDLLERERETEEQLSRLQAQVADAIRDREQLGAQLSEHDAAHQQLIAERAQLATELSGRDEAHQQLLAEKEQLAAQLNEHDAAHQQLLAERAQLQQTLAERDKQEMELLLKEQEAQQRSDDLRAQIEASAAEQHRLARLLADTDALHQQALADHASDRSRFEQTLEAAGIIQERMKKSVADHQVELTSMEGITRELAPLAATGRLAMQISDELLGIIAAIDARSTSLLSDCPLESESRNHIEALRGDAIRAAALALQMTRTDSPGATAVDDTNTSGETA